MIQAPAFAETPRQALDLRRKLLHWWSNPSEHVLAWMDGSIPKPSEEDPSFTRDDDQRFLVELIAGQRAILSRAELFLISDEMTEVARAAALTLPTFALQREDFPSDTGLLIFHHAPTSGRSSNGEVHDDVAVTWSVSTGPRGPSVFFQWYEDRDGGSIPPHLDATKARAINQQFLPKLLPGNWAVGLLGEDFAPVLANGPLLGPTMSALLLMQQPLAARERAASQPLDGRRARRAGVADTGVTVIKLRHLSHAHATGVSRPVEYRHRWIVRGHWRNQWLPSRGVHRPTWISPHIKGPENRPIKMTERVNVWSR